MNKLRTALRSLLDRGFFHIFIGNTLVKCVSLCSAMLLPRILVPEQVYGVLSTVDNINSYLILLNGMGLANSVLRFCAMKESVEERSAIFRFCLKFGLAADLVVLLLYVPVLLYSGLFSSGSFGPAKPYILAACLIPLLTYVMEIALLYLRANLRNKAYSTISVVYTLLYAAFQVALAWQLSLTGVYIGRYLALSLTAALSLGLIYRSQTLSREHILLPRQEKKQIVLYGMGAMASSAFSLIMPYNETLVVNLVLRDLSATAYYKAASMLPGNLQYIATSVVVFIFPYFAKHTGDGRWIAKNTKGVILAMTAIMIPIIVVGYALTPQIIALLYGESYAPAISIMRPMWVAFGINAVLRVPAGNILAALGELRFNLMLTGVVSVLHLILDVFFISTMGIGGAVYALMIAYLVSGIFSVVYLFVNCKRKW